MIYLDADQHKTLRAEATKLGISMAELLRRLVKRHLQERSVPMRVPPEAYMKIVALGASGRTDVSERHDAHLGEALRREHSR